MNIKELSTQEKFIKQLVVHPDIAFHKELPSIQVQLITWVKEEINFLKTVTLQKTELVSKKISGIRTKHLKTDLAYGIKLQLNGVYIDNDILYVRLSLQNHSNVSFDVDNIDFTIRDRQKSRRTSSQDLRLTPVYVYKPFVSVQADASANCVIALPKFTLLIPNIYRYKCWKKMGQEILVYGSETKRL